MFTPAVDPDQALLQAAMNGHLDAAREALGEGADPNKMEEGCSPLFWAAQEGYTEMVGLLLDAGADIDLPDPGGFSPLKQAVGNNHPETVECLLLRGANVEGVCPTDGNSTVLHTAAAYGRMECIRLLLLYGADRRTQNHRGQTPYDIAIECGETAAAELLFVNK